MGLVSPDIGKLQRKEKRFLVGQTFMRLVGSSKRGFYSKSALSRSSRILHGGPQRKGKGRAESENAAEGGGKEGFFRRWNEPSLMPGEEAHLIISQGGNMGNETQAADDRRATATRVEQTCQNDRLTSRADRRGKDDARKAAGSLRGNGVTQQ